MAQTIPISQVVTINPGVIGTGGNPLALNGVFLSSDTKIPIGSLLSFPSADSVADYFGETSALAGLASNYFLSFENSQKKPQSMIFAPWITAATPAWVRGTSLAGVLISTIKAVTGTLAVTINGTEYTAATVDLSDVTTFTEAATKIGTLLGITSVAGVTWDAAFSCFVITTTETGTVATISAVTGTAANGLGLADGTVSQGGEIDTPISAMNRIKDLTQNWATFTVIDSTTTAQKQDFAQWNTQQNKRYAYIPWDDDPQAIVNGSDTCFGALCKQFKYEGVLPVYNAAQYSAFLMGCFASVDWNANNGRITAAFKTQSGLLPAVRTLQTATNLLTNGYTYYGAYSGSGDNTFNFSYNGQAPGSAYLWIDSYINQIFFNSQLQLALITMLLAQRSLPYNADGYTLIRAACSDPINQALLNGTIRRGVSLSESQKAQIVSAIGFDVSTELYTNGYYLYIGDASAQTRGQRQSPPISLYYMDGGSIQQITLQSIVVL